MSLYLIKNVRGIITIGNRGKKFGINLLRAGVNLELTAAASITFIEIDDLGILRLLRLDLQPIVLNLVYSKRFIIYKSATNLYLSFFCLIWTK